MSSSENTINMYKAALNKMSVLFNNAKPKEKHVYIYPLRSSGITLNHAKELGFKCSKWLWKNCMNKAERNLGKIFINIDS